jgi:hypothetical protein
VSGRAGELYREPVTSGGGAGRAGLTRAALSRPSTSGKWPVMERSVLGTVLGLPPAAAVAIAAVLTALGVFIDLATVGTLGLLFKICYFTGCVLAVAWVRRRSLFVPMVQPPLLLGIAVPAVVLLGGGVPSGAGFGEALVVIVAPLVNGFPTMALTTAVAAGFGAARIVVQRPQRPLRGPRAGRSTAARADNRAVSRAVPDGARGAART